MKKDVLKNFAKGTIVSYFIISISNLIRFVIAHYFFVIPNLLAAIEQINISEVDSVYNLASSYFYIGYAENSIEIQVYMFAIAILLGIMYSVVKYFKNKNK